MLARGRIGIALPGLRAARVGFMMGGAAPVFPWPGASVDLDFIRRQYWWNGAARTEANFTTLTLNGAIWETRGLNVSTCTVNPDITITLATLGLTMPPCVFGFAGQFLSTPAALKTFFQFDNVSQNERYGCNLTNAPVIQLATFTGGVNQAGANPGTPHLPSVRFGAAYSAQLNEVLTAINGVDAVTDTVATMPTVTRLLLGANAAGTSFPPAILSRLVVFSAVKTQTDLNTLSIQMRDAP